MIHKPRLIAITIIKNESKNYLRAWLKNMYRFVDFHIFLDDASTDETPDILQKAINSGYAGILHRRDTSLFAENEPKLRAELWAYTRQMAHDNDWILIVDADEFYNERLLKFKRRLNRFNQAGFTHCKVSCLDMWDKNHFRTDGFWSPMNAAIRLIAYQDVPFGQNNTHLHQPCYPKTLTLDKPVEMFIPKFHMAYLKPSDRHKRYHFYKTYVSPTDSISYKHACSILDEKPTLQTLYTAKQRLFRILNPKTVPIFKDIK